MLDVRSSQTRTALHRTAMKRKSCFPSLMETQVPKVILERIDTVEEFKVLFSKHIKLEQETPKMKEEFVNEESFSLKSNHAIDATSGSEEVSFAGSVSLFPSLGIDSIKNTTAVPKNELEEAGKQTDHTSDETLVLDSAAFSTVYVKEETREQQSSEHELGQTENCLETDGEAVNLETEEVISDDSMAESEFSANNTLLARCVVEPDRRSGLRNLKKQSYRNQYGCDECSLKFRYLKDYKQHMKEHLTSLDPNVSPVSKMNVHACPDCPRVFRVLKDLNQHSTEHCPSRMLNQTGAKLKNTDSEERPKVNAEIKAYCCVKCAKKFNQANDLFRHMKEHKVVTVSQEAEPKQESPAVQVRVNPERKAYCCDECPRKFRYMNDLQEHAAEHQKNGFSKPCKVSSVPKPPGVRAELRIVLKKESYPDAKSPLKGNAGQDEGANFEDVDENRQPESRPDSKLLQSPELDVDIDPSHNPEEQSYCCSECPLKFQTFRGLSRHLVVHKEKLIDCLPDGYFSCAHCSLKSKYKIVIKSHVKVHFPSRGNYTCKLCSREFQYKYSYDRHAAVHSSEKPFSCSVCGAKVKSKRTLQEHMERHSLRGESSMSQVSDDNFSSALRDPTGLLKGPCRDLSRDPNEKPFACELCPSRFLQNADLVRHMNDLHSSPKEYPCNLCDRVFHNETSLIRHLEAHSNEGRFTSSNCSQIFKEKSKLMDHVDSKSCKLVSGKPFLSGAETFSCTECPAKYSSRSSLYTHTKIKHSGMRFPCSFCPEEFQLRRELKRHLKSHAADKREARISDVVGMKKRLTEATNYFVDLASDAQCVRIISKTENDIFKNSHIKGAPNLKPEGSESVGVVCKTENDVFKNSYTEEIPDNNGPVEGSLDVIPETQTDIIGNNYATLKTVSDVALGPIETMSDVSRTFFDLTNEVLAMPSAPEVMSGIGSTFSSAHNTCNNFIVPSDVSQGAFVGMETASDVFFNTMEIVSDVSRSVFDFPADITTAGSNTALTDLDIHLKDICNFPMISDVPEVAFVDVETMAKPVCAEWVILGYTSSKREVGMEN